jgi:hypothetical protein
MQTLPPVIFVSNWVHWPVTRWGLVDLCFVIFVFGVHYRILTNRISPFIISDSCRQQRSSVLLENRAARVLTRFHLKELHKLFCNGVSVSTVLSQFCRDSENCVNTGWSKITQPILKYLLMVEIQYNEFGLINTQYSIKYEERRECIHRWTLWAFLTLNMTLFFVFWFQCNLFFDK